MKINQKEKKIRKVKSTFCDLDIEEEILKKIKEARKKDDKVIKVEVRILRNDEWQIEEGLVLKKEKVYILKDEKLRLEIIQLHYNMPIIRHRGQWKTVELVTRNY